jgi:glycosyltransferase involved in cell wall biosynthesis
MGYDNFGFKIGIEGEKEFKNALRDINQSFKVLGSEMKLATSEFDKNDKSIAAVTARNEVLNKAIDAQKDKISTLEDALKNASESFGENDRRTQNWAIQLNNAKAQLNGMERELDETTSSADDLSEELEDTGKSAEDAGGKFEKFGGVLKGMGGQFGDIVATDQQYQKWVKCYKMIFVETVGMRDTLRSVGVNNVSVFPNCRKKPETDVLVRPRSGKLKCVCFSMIYPEKGIDTVLEAARQLPDVSFEFWGVIRDEYKSEFLAAVNAQSNCRYRGVYNVEGDNVYKMLNQYDLLLFPTRLSGEGVPGTLIEAKIAALPAIVSNVAYNAQLVENGVSGLVMQECTVKCLVEAIKIAENDELLTKLKCGAQESGKWYYFEEYLDDLINQF